METNLTKEMKKKIVWFKPLLNTKMRTIRYATEVWTPSGIVDAIRFEDYKEKDVPFCAMIEYERFKECYQKYFKNLPDGKRGKCKIPTETYPNKNCKGCVWHEHSYEIGMMITCYECKISVSNFKSKNGHNFHGNRNYYVVPKEIVEKIKDSVPNDIGIISYYQKSGQFRVEKECNILKVDEQTKVLLLYNALKKWVDEKHRNKV